MSAKRTLIITRESHALLAAHARGSLIGGVEQPDGLVLIVVDQDVFDRLQALDADPDKAIALACSGLVGHA